MVAFILREVEVLEASDKASGDTLEVFDDNVFVLEVLRDIAQIEGGVDLNVLGGAKGSDLARQLVVDLEGAAVARPGEGGCVPLTVVKGRIRLGEGFARAAVEPVNQLAVFHKQADVVSVPKMLL